jgi:hypothetical protein
MEMMMLKIETTPAANSERAVQPDAVLAFVASLAQMSLRVPQGANQSAHLANQMRAIRRGARHILHHQYDEVAQALATMIGEGRVIYVGEAGFSVVEESTQ